MYEFFRSFKTALYKQQGEESNLQSDLYVQNSRLVHLKSPCEGNSIKSYSATEFQKCV